MQAQDLGYFSVERNIVRQLHQALPRKQANQAVLLYVSICDHAAYKERPSTLFCVKRPIKPGEMETTERLLADELGTNRRTLGRYLDLLKQFGAILYTSAYGGTIIGLTALGRRMRKEPTAKAFGLPVDLDEARAAKRADSAPPQTLEPQGLEAEPVEPRAAETRQFIKGEKTKTLIPPPNPPGEIEPARSQARVKEPDGGGSVDDLISYAQDRLGLFAPVKQREQFALEVAVARAAGKSDDYIRGLVDLVADHPIAKARTKSINRVFYAKQALADCQDWDQHFKGLLSEAHQRAWSQDSFVERVGEVLGVGWDDYARKRYQPSEVG